jgi:protein-L-isoaspartate(D-aspartate) O-methyltransferase
VYDPEKEEKQYSLARARMVRRQLARRDITDQRVLEAMGRVPRQLFVPNGLRHLAYDDGPLSIGAGQTISQPYIVALMTQLLKPGLEDRVLEVGVGSGYQTAILSGLVREVIGIERIEELAVQARERLALLCCSNARVIVGDGSQGFPPAAPYNSILVAAAAPDIPKPLVDQLAPGGRLIIPVGRGYEQVIVRATQGAGGLHIEYLTPVRFVPLIGRWGFHSDEEER